MRPEQRQKKPIQCEKPIQCVVCGEPISPTDWRAISVRCGRCLLSMHYDQLERESNR